VSFFNSKVMAGKQPKYTIINHCMYRFGGRTDGGGCCVHENEGVVVEMLV
jgi:hypothetical protein